MLVEAPAGFTAEGPIGIVCRQFVTNSSHVLSLLFIQMLHDIRYFHGMQDPGEVYDALLFQGSMIIFGLSYWVEYATFSDNKLEASLIIDLHHVSLIVADTERALGFYRDVLGLEVVSARPDLGYPGAWLKVGGYQIHLLQLPNPDPSLGRPEHGGRDRHLALCVQDYQGLIDTLDAAGIPYSASRSGRKALFCRDPDGNALEFIAC